MYVYTVCIHLNCTAGFFEDIKWSTIISLTWNPPVSNGTSVIHINKIIDIKISEPSSSLKGSTNSD